MPDTFRAATRPRRILVWNRRGYWDILGIHHTTALAAKQSILRRLGVPADSAESFVARARGADPA